MFDRFTEQARAVLVCAEAEARLAGADAVDSVHLALACLSQSDSDCARLVATVDLSAETLAFRLRVTGDPGPSRDTLRLTDEAKRALEATMRLAMTLGSPMVTSAYLLAGLLTAEPDGELGDLMRDEGCDVTELELNLSKLVPGEFIDSGRRAAEPTSEGAPPRRASGLS